MNVYKNILNTIAKPMAGLNKFQVAGVLERLKKGTIEEQLIASSLERLDNYINLSLQLSKEQSQRMADFVDKHDDIL